MHPGHPLALALLAASAGAAPGFAVLELFTSEGCSSCPPADRLLSAFVAEAGRSGLPILALSFHVDYWNHLGWQDPFSEAAYTGRQQEYARTLSGRVYTPQLVLNGVEEFVGSDARKARAAVAAALAGEAPAPLEVSARWQDGGTAVALAARVEGARPGDVLNAALVEKGIRVPVRRGENGGRTLAHDNVVRAFATAALGSGGKASLSLEVPAGARRENLSVVAYVQEEGTRKITAAGAGYCR